MQLAAQRMSVAEYLAMEEESHIKHEYLDGAIFAVAGESCEHNSLVINLAGHAWQARSSHDCQIFVHGMKVHVPMSNCFYYPDVVASCDPADGVEDYLRRPCFVIEVASPATASTDRREKRRAYLTLTSLEDYVIVEASRMRVSAYRRAQRILEVLDAPDDILKLTCIRLEIALKDIYAGVKLPNEEVLASSVQSRA